MFQLIPTRIEMKIIKKKRSAFTFHRTIQTGLLAITLSFTEIFTSTSSINSSIDNSLTQFVQTSHLPSSLQIIRDLSIKNLWFVHTVPQQSLRNLSVCSVLHSNHLVGQFELFILFIGQCWYQHWGKVVLSGKYFCCIDRLIPQSHNLVENCLSDCKILY